MEAEGQYSKRIDAIPEPDIAISMGCNVGCPFIGRPFDDNWGLEDPTGGTDDEFKAVIEQIENCIYSLRKNIVNPFPDGAYLILRFLSSDAIIHPSQLILSAGDNPVLSRLITF